MSRSIALLSGKGGSGKTTFALALANLLSLCKIKVLLIDCDLVTNGATYFYEHRLSENKPITSFFDLLYQTNQPKSCLPIAIDAPNYYFIPSIRKISEDVTDFHPFDVRIQQSFEMHYASWEKLYDVIIFDCSAGYSDVLRYIIPKADINLVVLEPDKVSMAAMRSLYLKLAPMLYESKFYQIFNKVRPEEINEYQRREGSFFTSIGAIAFDWSIRDAFTIAKVPTLDNTGIDFGMQLSSICSILFEGDIFQKRLSTFSIEIALKKARIEQRETRKSFTEYKTGGLKKDSNLFNMFIYIVPIFAVLMSRYFVGLDHDNILISKDLLSSSDILLYILIVMISVSLSWFSNWLLNNKEKRMKLKTYDELFKTQQARIFKLEKMLEELES